jgi:hypothetical protein
MGRRTRSYSVRVVAFFDLLRTPGSSSIVALDRGSIPSEMPLAGSRTQRAISSALYIGVVPVSYYSVYSRNGERNRDVKQMHASQLAV